MTMPRAVLRRLGISERKFKSCVTKVKRRLPAKRKIAAYPICITSLRKDK